MIKAVTINTNAWTDAGHAVNQLYDILYMMGRDDIAVGVGGEGGIQEDGTILPNVGGYLPIIEQVICFLSKTRIIKKCLPEHFRFYFCFLECHQPYIMLMLLHL